MDDVARSHLSNLTIHEYTEAKPFLQKYAQSLEGTTATVSEGYGIHRSIVQSQVFVPGSTNFAIGEMFEKRMYQVRSMIFDLFSIEDCFQKESPIQGMKARKNDVELGGIRKASVSNGGIRWNER